jgi:hypothetical protein
MSNRVPSKQKLISIVTKGKIRKTAIFDLIVRIIAIIMPYIAVFAFNKQPEGESELPFRIYLVAAIVVMVFNIAAYIIGSFKHFTRKSTPIENLLAEICKLFNVSIMPDGGARATIYIYRKYSKNKVVVVNNQREYGCFYRLCDTDGAVEIMSRTEHELKCFDAYHNEVGEAVVTDLTPEEIEKSKRSDIRAIFAMPIYNRKNVKVGVLSIDTCKKITECYALEKHDDESDFKHKKGMIGNSLKGICRNLIQQMHLSEQ